PRRRHCRQILAHLQPVFTPKGIGNRRSYSGSDARCVVLLKASPTRRYFKKWRKSCMEALAPRVSALRKPKRARLGPRRLTPLIDHLSLYRATLIVAFRVARRATAEWVYQLRWAFAGGLFCQFIDSHFFSASLLRKDLVGCAPFSPPYGP